MDFYYSRADEQPSAFAGVSASNVMATYEAPWLCDMRSNRPLRVASANLSATITPLAASIGEVGLVAVINSNADPGKVFTFGGDISTTCTMAATARPNRIPLCPWSAITPVASVDNVTVSLTGNSFDVIVGEVMFGKRRSLPRPPYPGDSGAEGDFSRLPDMDVTSIPGYDPALGGGRTLKWTCILTTAQLEEAILIYEAQMNKTRPTLFIPDILKQDAWAAYLDRPSYNINEPGLWNVELNWTELPRRRWP